MLSSRENNVLIEKSILFLSRIYTHHGLVTVVDEKLKSVGYMIIYFIYSKE